MNQFPNDAGVIQAQSISIIDGPTFLLWATLRRGCNNANEVLTYACFLLVENLTIQSLLPLWLDQVENFCPYYQVGTHPQHRISGYGPSGNIGKMTREYSSISYQRTDRLRHSCPGQLFLGLWLRSCVVTVLFSLIAKLGHWPNYHHDFSWLSSVCACATRTTVSVDPHCTTRRGSPHPPHHSTHYPTHNPTILISHPLLVFKLASPMTMQVGQVRGVSFRI